MVLLLKVTRGREKSLSLGESLDYKRQGQNHPLKFSCQIWIFIKKIQYHNLMNHRPPR